MLELKKGTPCPFSKADVGSAVCLSCLHKRNETEVMVSCSCEGGEVKHETKTSRESEKDVVNKLADVFKDVMADREPPEEMYNYIKTDIVKRATSQIEEHVNSIKGLVGRRSGELEKEIYQGIIDVFQKLV